MFYSVYRKERCCLLCGREIKKNHIRAAEFFTTGLALQLLLIIRPAFVFSFYMQRGNGLNEALFITLSCRRGCIPNGGTCESRPLSVGVAPLQARVGLEASPTCGKRVRVSPPSYMLPYELLPSLYRRSVRPSLTCTGGVHCGADREVERIGLTLFLFLLLLSCIESHRNTIFASGAPCYGEAYREQTSS